ncbi:MAG: hypothetical protein IJL99_04870 [Firmicutes bacterium]|nr:hypothetical protein [Bacillota bacterium]
MEKKKIISLILAGVFALSSAFAFTACGSGDDQQSGDDQTVSQLSDEELAAKAEELNKDETNFFGTWEATSNNAKYLYGHLLITINEDGTFDADITDEKFSGTWEKIDGGIKYDSELIHGKLFFGKKCRMVIEEETEDEDLHVTLVKRDQ